MSTNERPSEAEIRAALAELMTTADVDDAMGWTSGTAAKSRRRPHGLPEPDAMVGRTPVYFRATFERWRESRPGQGAGGGRPWHRDEPVEAGQ
ncbi:hypothetical protein [Pseudonocardia sp. McavD-2-B]|uniref:hypothetical protein n=1 Tax=Pseudonocardia sp. McavD-2-B TaxID=2954499 RepID=UPI0020974B93|nr:hypothetical protein [Pseudonocardia sp. McavD-2-B]MCO7195049.1 hypothetical protein [Pseudonocardia sp. McavD-2-B]